MTITKASTKEIDTKDFAKTIWINPSGWIDRIINVILVSMMTQKDFRVLLLISEFMVLEWFGVGVQFPFLIMSK